MIKPKSDPFLAQTSAMLLILLVMYFIGDNNIFDQILTTR